MKRNSLLGVILFLFGLLFVPVVINQIVKKEPRQLKGIGLSQLDFQEVNFINQDQDLQLGGLLFVPEGEGPFPAVVVVHGSGQSRRDNGWYLSLVHYLQERGILVLLPDKRGSEKSEGDWRKASIEDLATDTEASLTFLKEQSEVPLSQLGLVGMSQGGQVVSLLASQKSEIDFAINVSSNTVSMREQFLFEENHNLREIGFLPGISNALSYAPTYYHMNWGGNKDFWKANANFSSIPLWEKVDIESFLLFGEGDTNVPSVESKKRLEALGKPNLKVKIYVGSTHALEDPVNEGNDVFREDALKDIVDFIYAQGENLQ